MYFQTKFYIVLKWGLHMTMTPIFKSDYLVNYFDLTILFLIGLLISIIYTVYDIRHNIGNRYLAASIVSILMCSFGLFFTLSELF
mgnify:CR=1 FL=1